MKRRTFLAALAVTPKVVLGSLPPDIAGLDLDSMFRDLRGVVARRNSEWIDMLVPSDAKPMLEVWWSENAMSRYSTPEYEALLERIMAVGHP